MNALQTARAIALAAPERTYLLTLAGEDFQQVRGRVKRFRYDLRQAVGAFEDCWHVEPNPSGDGQHHVHGIQYGCKLPVEEMRRAAVRNGFGQWIGIRRVRNVEASSLYGVKLAALASAAYSLKGVTADLETFLAANGNRMVHASRGFWREGPAGGRLPGVRTARRVAAQRREVDPCPATGSQHRWEGESLPRVVV